MSWRDYQEKVARLFRQLGCSAKVNEPVKGVRGKHYIDVWVVFRRFGILIRWAIDCKYWKARIPIGEVQKLNKVIENIGADRGFLISEEGFQRGAFKAARHTNITLTTFRDLKDLVRDDLYKILIVELERKTTILQNKLRSFYITKWEKGPNASYATAHSFPRPGLNYKEYSKISGRLALLSLESFEAIRMRRKKIPIDYDNSGMGLIYTKNIKEFIEVIGKLLGYVENWIDKEKKRLKKTKSKK